MAIRIQVRRDTAANWALFNPVLAEGELALETTTKKLKLGDGTTAWNDLDYYNLGVTGTSNYKTEIRTLTALEISDKALTLAETPEDANTVLLEFQGSVRQFPNIDFVVSGTDLSWDSMGMETLAEEGELIIIQYNMS